MTSNIKNQLAQAIQNWDPPSVILEQAQSYASCQQGSYWSALHQDQQGSAVSTIKLREVCLSVNKIDF